MFLLKTSAHTIHNAYNILYSIVKNNQIDSCCKLNEENFLNLDSEVISYCEKSIDEIANDVLQRMLRIKFKNLYKPFQTVSKCKLFGQLYSVSMCISDLFRKSFDLTFF